MSKTCEYCGTEFSVEIPHLTKGSKPKKYCSKECGLKRQKERYKQRKILVLEHYGGKCACCEESRIEFLTLDHLNNDGKKHREQINRSGSGLYSWAVKNNFPSEPKIQVFCWNCQEAKAHYGTCPHKRADNNV